MSQNNIGVCIIVQNPQGHILMGIRKNSYQPGFWGLPGGRVEEWEKIESAAWRELAEETTLTPTQLKYVGVVREKQPDKVFIHFVYQTSATTKQPQTAEPNKCEGWQWVDFVSLKPDPMLKGHQAAINLLRTNSQLIDL